jgi:hypothetical protein
MKWTASLAIGLILTPLAMMGQTASRSHLPLAADTASSTLSDREKNIRVYIELMRRDLRQNKAAIMDDVMQLDARDALKFRPIYVEFEAALARLYDEVVVLIRDYVARYQNLSGADADDLANRLLDLEQRRNETKRKYYEQFKAALDPIIAMRFLQVENQIERLIDLQIASELPVVERTQP